MTRFRIHSNRQPDTCHRPADSRLEVFCPVSARSTFVLSPPTREQNRSTCYPAMALSLPRIVPFQLFTLWKVKKINISVDSKVRWTRPHCFFFFLAAWYSSIPAYIIVVPSRYLLGIDIHRSSFYTTSWYLSSRLGAAHKTFSACISCFYSLCHRVAVQSCM